MEQQIGDDAVLRGAFLDTRQNIRGILDVLLEFMNAFLCFAELARDLVLSVVPLIENSHLRFGNALLGAGDLRDRLAALALDLRKVALQSEQMRLALEALADQFQRSGNLLVDQRDAPAVRGLLRPQSRYLLVGLGNALTDQPAPR